MGYCSAVPFLWELQQPWSHLSYSRIALVFFTFHYQIHSQNQINNLCTLRKKRVVFNSPFPKERQQHMVLRAVNENEDYYCSAGCGKDCGKGVCSLSLFPTPLDSPYIFTRGKGPLYQPTHPLRTKQKSCSVFFCSISFPTVGGEEILGLCSRVTLSNLGRFKSEITAFCHQHCPFHWGTFQQSSLATHSWSQ